MPRKKATSSASSTPRKKATRKKKAVESAKKEEPKTTPVAAMPSPPEAKPEPEVQEAKQAEKQSAPPVSRQQERAPVNINIKRMSEQKLLDQKLMRRKSKFGVGWFYTLVFLIVATGAVFFVYRYFFGSPDEVSPSESPGEQIVVPEPPPSEEEEEDVSEQEQTPVVIRQVRILDTPTGYLNVRTGPGTSYEQIDRVDPGDVFDFISEDQQAGWYEIRLDDGRAGWVIKQYAVIDE